MPAVIPVHVAIRARLRDTAKDVLSYNERLEAVIAVKSAQPAGIFHGKIDHSAPPWSAPVANAILDLHAWSRKTETVMRLHLGFPARFRGGSSANTANSLDNIMRLAEGSDDDSVKDVTRWLDAWIRHARIILGETESAKRLPRHQGQSEPTCPWCHKDTLRQLALAGTIRCIDTTCKDEEGRRPAAQLEMFQGEWVLRWQDGVIGVP